MGKNGLIQWTQIGNKYYPAGKVTKNLPPGYYTIDSDMNRGLYFNKKETKTEELLRFPDAQSDAVIEEIEKFWDMESKFRDSNIPYKRGIAMYGPPGSGKTCTIRLVIESLTKHRNGVVVEFPGVSTFKEGYEVLREIHADMPIVVLMEDLDAILRGGYESEILNLLDGAYNIDRIVFLATTNYPEQLGSRVLNRPSRFDKKFHIGMPSAEAREIFIKSKLIEEDEKVIKRWVDDTEGFSIAHLKELYVATRILGDSYESAIKTLREMSTQVASDTFDCYNVETKAVAKVTSWDDYGTGEAYIEGKKRFGGVLSESRTTKGRRRNHLTPGQIADLMDE